MSQRIGIIGAGKVGTSLGKYFDYHNLELIGFYSKTLEHAKEAAKECHASCYLMMRDLIEDCDILFLTVPDDAVATVWEEMKAFSLTGKTVCHTSGLLTSQLFSGAGERGAKAAAIHVMRAFGERFSGWEQMKDAPFTVEGSGWAEISELLTFCGNAVYPIRAGEKAKYHAAGVFASNFVLALLSVSERLLRDASIPPGAAKKMLSGLILGNVEAALQKGTEEALSGPLERGDIGTLCAHMAALGEEDRELYTLLSRELLHLAKRKNPDRDYEKIEEMIQNEANG